MKNKILKSYNLVENINEPFNYNCKRMDKINKKAIEDINQREKKDAILSLEKCLDSRNIAGAENYQRQRSVNVDSHLADYQGDYKQ